MAYVPPHKRSSKNNDGEGSSQSPVPKPELPPFLINYKKPKSKSKSAYACEDIHRWFAAGLDDHIRFPPSVDLQPVSVESIHGTIVQRVALFNNIDSAEEKSSNAVIESFTRRPWECIAENVVPDLISCFEDFRSKLEDSDHNHVKVTPTIITRVGKVLFRRWRGSELLSEELLRPRRASYYTDVLDSYIEYLVKEGVLKSGLEFEQEQEVFRVYFDDVTQPDISMWCKCRVLEDGKLNPFKIEHVYGRHMLRDISCLEKNLDMRLDLCTKTTVTNFPEDDFESLKSLINSAVVDPAVRGKFRVRSVWRIRRKRYENQTLTLKIKDVDRSSGGEATREVVIMLKGVVSELMKQNADRNLISEMLKNDLKVIWNNILCCERFPKDITDEGHMGQFPLL
ncbi:uncharacterized protein LOC133790601 [Humulus lupulus]|uniref:uncharacterized protein LOC133790601 n=1 Tax=Humulus lupulus TaxID=3486 RepID=UPI002B411169|nr:uncharacterized protein LOC133790601 [Humulus lupulus]XP_062084262.1 uncharacterized protein LOC133790601 [Humulus lupulus]XP_062084263.1 uncharacterized protein LOC133790601 [Humulus lupulus]XP_062084264.1 uncharacterized protein LOC133790601 [Humulus lupulus]